MIKTTLKSYSSKLYNLKNKKYEHFAQAAWDISPILLHNVIL